MANKPKRSFRKYLRGNVDETLAGGTLASRTLVSNIFDETVDSRTYCSSLRATHSLSAFTPSTGIGPVMVGVAHNDYTASEVEEFIENSGSWNEGNLTAQEVAKRKIRIIGIFDAVDNAQKAAVLNDGQPITTKLGWILMEGQSLDQWMYNLGANAFMTTDPQYHMEGHVNLWPR